MKKLLTLFAAVVLAVGAYAQNTVTDSIKAVAAKETEPGKVTILWQADSTISKVYLVYLYAADMTTYQTTPIAFLAGYAANFAVAGYPGYYGIGSAVMLQYGQSYLILKENTSIPAETLSAFQTGWENNVDASDFTLNAGYYYITVVGYDATGKTITEARKATLLQVTGEAQGVENVFESQKPVKFIAPDGQVRILRDGKMYNMSGALVK